MSTEISWRNQADVSQFSIPRAGSIRVMAILRQSTGGAGLALRVRVFIPCRNAAPEKASEGYRDDIIFHCNRVMEQPQSQSKYVCPTPLPKLCVAKGRNRSTARPTCATGHTHT